MRPLIVLVVASAVACGPSAASLRSARGARYEAPFATVWNAVVTQTYKKYPIMKREDPVGGYLVSEWRVIQLLDSEGNQQTTSAAGTVNQQHEQQQAANLAPGQVRSVNPALLFRVFIHVKGPPWRVIVDGEAAEYKPGMAMLVPFHHGQSDEPPWVSARINSLTMDIYDQLKKYAITETIKAPPRRDVAEKVQDTTPWANLPDRDAARLVGQVHAAARGRDTEQLRATMADDFQWTLDAEGSADTAVALWAADPTKMKQLAITIEKGCAADAASGDVVCVSEPMEARFRKVDGAWKFVLFVSR